VILGGVHSYFVTDDSAQVIAPIFKGEAVDTMDCFTLEVGDHILYRRASNELPIYTEQLFKRPKTSPRSD